MIRCLALLAVACVSVAQAEQSQRFGAVEIHYNAMLSSDLLPDVAKAYKIDRSKTRGIVTISVLKKNAMGVAQPVPARLTAYLVNLNNQLGNIDMREVREGTAIYYLGEFRVAPPDTLKFTVTVEAAGEPKHEVTFSQKFYK
ncbi:MAG: DUF4426 domain-containing protein [Hydrogenophilaceae bacterium]|nr:DUF4426 domain-containing protein [Hydrogenophilaceae bacterium]